MSRAYFNENEPKAAAWLRELIAAGLIPAGDVDERSIADVRPRDLRGYSQCHFFAGIKRGRVLPGNSAFDRGAYGMLGITPKPSQAIGSLLWPSARPIAGTQAYGRLRALASRHTIRTLLVHQDSIDRTVGVDCPVLSSRGFVYDRLLLASACVDGSFEHYLLVGLGGILESRLISLLDRARAQTVSRIVGNLLDHTVFVRAVRDTLACISIRNISWKGVRRLIPLGNGDNNEYSYVYYTLLFAGSLA